MNTHSTVLDNASVEAPSSDRILQIALAAWRQGNIVQVVDQFNDQFTFTDHALGLEFKDKGRLIDFLAKTRERFPDSGGRDNILSARSYWLKRFLIVPLLSTFAFAHSHSLPCATADHDVCQKRCQTTLQSWTGAS